MADPPFDPAKDATNRAKHGLPLAFGERLFEDRAHLIVPSIRLVDGEERFKVIGLANGKVHTAIFTWRRGKPRFISVRRSNNGEEKLYRPSS